MTSAVLFKVLYVENAFLQVKWLPTFCSVRYSRKINIQKPAPPHYKRALVLDVCKPILPRKIPEGTPLYELCEKAAQVKTVKKSLPNIYALFLTKFFVEKVEKSRCVVFCHSNIVTGEETFDARVLFHRQKMDLSWPQPHLIRLAAELIPKYESFLPLFSGEMTAVICSDEPQIGKIIKILKKIPQLTLMAGVVDGQFLSKNELVQYSQLPNLLSAQAGVVGLLNASASQIVSNITYHQQTLVSHLQQHIDIQQKPQECEDVKDTSS